MNHKQMYTLLQAHTPDCVIEHLDKYFDIVSNSYIGDDYAEDHHILPVSLLPYYRKAEWNIVRLRYEDHVKAHYHLALAMRINSTAAALHAVQLNGEGSKHNRPISNDEKYKAGETLSKFNVASRKIESIYRPPAAVSIGKTAMLDAIREFGCPITNDLSHPLYTYLLDKYTYPQLSRLEDASEWEHQCQKMKANGFDIDVWHSYSILKEIGRRFFINIFAQKDMKIFDDRIDVLTDMYDLITSVGDTMTSNRRKNNSIPDDCLTQLSDSFWGEYIRSKTSEWFYEENKNERLKVFKILMGMRVESSGNWTFINKKPSWDVALTNAEGNKFRARAKHIPDIPKFCEHFGVDRKQITQMKTKEIKAMVSELHTILNS